MLPSSPPTLALACAPRIARGQLALATLAVLGSVACGGSSAPAPVPSVALSTISPPASPADLEVARVNGRSVWGSCVAAQLGRGAPSRQAALDQCIAF